MGFCLYDFANSAYTTTTVAAVLPAYFAEVVAPGGIELFGARVAASGLWGFAVGLAGLIAFALAPFLGAVADFTGAKKPFLAGFCLLGAAATVGLLGVGPGLVFAALALFVLGQIGFLSGNVFYDAYLPDVAPPERMDMVSAKGYAWGYFGGGFQFALCLGLIALHESFGLSKDQAARTSMAFSGLWWLAFAGLALYLLPKGRPAERLPLDLQRFSPTKALGIIALRRVWASVKAIPKSKRLSVFLIAFFFYNDGIQTCITMAVIFGKEELGLSTTLLMTTLLVIQGTAHVSSLVLGAAARRLGAIRALTFSLVVWTLVALAGLVVTTGTQFLVMGAAVGLVLGGSQALSRSLYASMIPRERSAEFFGFFSVVNKFSSILGPFVFAGATQLWGSARFGVASLALFFLVGIVFLVKLGRLESGALEAEQGME